MKNFTVTILKDETPLQTTIQAQSYDDAVQIAFASFEIILDVQAQWGENYVITKKYHINNSWN